ncbi:MAG: type II toxin-antitoxin system VapC family toxin [Candidatus Dormibacteraceae bacterium]
MGYRDGNRYLEKKDSSFLICYWLCEMKRGINFYLDTSALVKLIRAEPETSALEYYLDKAPVVSSALVRTELLRAAHRSGDAGEIEKAEELLERLVLMLPTMAMFDQAGHLGPPLMRSLDAIHLVSAAALGDDLQQLITYDQRMVEGASLLGISVAVPHGKGGGQSG